MSLTTPEKIRKLQRAFYVKAKEQPNQRFHQLYDKVWREDIVRYAYQRCKANQGAAGVDGQSFDQIEEYGRERWVGELAEEVRHKGYRPAAIRRVWIGKANGGRRPLGIATIRERVVQMAMVLVIEPIFEADLEPEQYGYRPKRSAQDAVRAVHSWLRKGHREVIDADLSGYFDSIPHAELMQCVARRISDREMLVLIKRFLKAPVRDRDEAGPSGKQKETGQGTPQGSPLSPLLANLYIRRFILGWKQRGGMERYGAHIVNYADDFVVCGKQGAADALVEVRRIMEPLKLRMNEDKTRVQRVPEESFDFLGYTFGRCYSTQTGRSYIGTRPSAILKMAAQVREEWVRRVVGHVVENPLRRDNALTGGGPAGAAGVGRGFAQARGRRDARPPLRAGEAGRLRGCRRVESGGCGPLCPGHARRRALPQHGFEQSRPAGEAEPLREESQRLEEPPPGAGPVAALPPQVGDTVQDRVEGEGE